MLIETDRDAMLAPLLQAGGIVERRQTLPILANILLEAHPESLHITATDLEVELKTQANARCEGEFRCTIPARKLLDICKALPEGAKVRLEIEGERAVLRSGRSRFSLSLLPAQDFPTIEPVASSQVLELDQPILKRLIERTQFAMAQQDVRYYLNGMLFELADGMLRAVATDGHRLSLSEVPFELDEPSDGFQIIVPRKAVMELGRLLGEEQDRVKLELSGSHIRLHSDDLIFTSKLIDGKYPEYRRVIPIPSENEFTVEREVFRQALSRTAILSNEKYRGVRVTLSPGLMELQAHNPEQEEAEEKLEVEYQGAELMIGFNVGYLLDVLNVVEEDIVVVDLKDSNSSALICGQGNAQSRYVVMPMRL